MKINQSEIDKMVSKILNEEIKKKSSEVSEKLHGGQHKLDVAKPKGKLTRADFEKLGDMKEGEDMEEQETEEGNAFSGALAKAKKYGKDSFEVDGKKYQVKESRRVKEVKEEDKWIQKTDMKKGELRKKLGIPEGEKIPKTKLNSLKKELMKKGEGDKKLSASDSKLLKQVNLALNLGNLKENVHSIKLTETELVDLIENIIKEQPTKPKSVKNNIEIKTPVGLNAVKKANSETGKINNKQTEDLSKKMNDYMKTGSKEKFTPEPKHFPMGNGELEEMDKMAYVPNKAAKEYVDNLAYPSILNLNYDEIHPNEEWVENNLVGSSKTGNNSEWANSVDTGVNKKFNEVRKKNLYGKEKQRSYKRVTQPVDNPGNGKESADNKELDNIFKQLESVDVRKEKLLKEEMDKMKKFIQYNDRTQ
jgi:hypothetical protein